MFEKSWYLFVLRIQAKSTLEPLIQVLEVQTAIAGVLCGVNAFD
jgi:glucose-6-phosphate isomerase